MPHPRQQAVIDFLAANGPAAPYMVGSAVFADTRRPAKSAQNRLAAMAKDGLVEGTGRMDGRRYHLTKKGQSHIRLCLPPATEREADLLHTPAVVQNLVDGWLRMTVERWDRAITATPPDLFHAKDMPPLPGNVSLGTFIEAVRSRIQGA